MPHFLTNLPRIIGYCAGINRCYVWDGAVLALSADFRTTYGGGQKMIWRAAGMVPYDAVMSTWRLSLSP